MKVAVFSPTGEQLESMLAEAIDGRRRSTCPYCRFTRRLPARTRNDNGAGMRAALRFAADVFLRPALSAADHVAGGLPPASSADIGMIAGASTGATGERIL